MSRLQEIRANKEFKLEVKESLEGLAVMLMLFGLLLAGATFM